MGFIDDVIQGVGKEIGKVQSRSQELLQSYQLTSQVRQLEGKKAAVFMEIGRLVFEKYQRGATVSEDQLIEKTREIVGYEHEIDGLHSELEALKAQSDPDRSATERSEAKAGWMPTPGFTCKHCAAPASAEKSFCPSCGGSLKDSDNGSKEKISKPPET